MGLRLWEFFKGPLARRQARLLMSFSGINLLFMEDYAPLAFLGIGLWWLHICVIGFIFLIDPFWMSMFFRLRGAHTCFNHVYVQHEITFLLQLERCTLFFRV